MKTPPGQLFLIPAPLAAGSPFGWDSGLREIILALRHFIVEDIRTARRFLRASDQQFPIDESQFYILNKDTPPEELETLVLPLIKGQNMGLMSEGGMPCIADPGAGLVAMAHQKNITVIPLPGPVSLMLALAGSGLNGQSFTFHGYLPFRKEALEKKLRELESLSAQTDYTQIFIETPFRNLSLLETILHSCRPQTLLSIGANLGSASPYLRTETLKGWKLLNPPIQKVPAVFLLHSPALPEPIRKGSYRR